jgi:hypothetical protein
LRQYLYPKHGKSLSQGHVARDAGIYRSTTSIFGCEPYGAFFLKHRVAGSGDPGAAVRATFQAFSCFYISMRRIWGYPLG